MTAPSDRQANAKTRLPRFCGFFTLVLLFASSDPPRTPAQEAPISVFGRRYDGFRQIFAMRRLKLGSMDEFLQEDRLSRSERWIVVCLGKADRLTIPSGGWRPFVQFGGALLIADDQAAEQFSGPFGVDFHPGPLMVPAGARTYADQLDCPLVLDFKTDHPLFAGVTALALNRSGYLGLERHGLAATLASAPTNARVGNGILLTRAAVVAGGEVDGRGRLLCVADQSVFINEMFLDPAGRPINARFAANCIDWMVHERDAESLRVLFVEEGEAISEWLDPRYQKGAWPGGEFEDKLDWFDKLLRAVEQMIREQEARRDPNTNLPMFDQNVRNLEMGAPPRTFLRIGILAGLSFLACLLAYWLWAALRPRQERDAETVREVDPTETLLDRARREIIDRKHYVELARRLAMLWFETKTGVHPHPGAPPPAASFDGGWTSRRWAARRWRSAWSLAAGGSASRMSLRGYTRFRADLSRLGRMLTSPLSAPSK